MRLSSPVDAVASALHHAALIALPDVNYQTRDYSSLRDLSVPQRREAMQNSESIPLVSCRRRPLSAECEVYAMFAQTWGSTALGFGGIGGAAMTRAYTVVIAGPKGHLAVYWDGRLAYSIDPSKQTSEQTSAFLADLQNRCTVAMAKAEQRYGATLPVVDGDDA